MSAEVRDLRGISADPSQHRWSHHSCGCVSGKANHSMGLLPGRDQQRNKGPWVRSLTGREGFSCLVARNTDNNPSVPNLNCIITIPFVCYLIQSSQQPCEDQAFIILIFQSKEVRHREVRKLAQGHRVGFELRHWLFSVLRSWRWRHDMVSW